MDSLGKFTTMIQSWKSEYLESKDINKQLSFLEEDEDKAEAHVNDAAAGGATSPNDFNELNDCKNFFEEKKVEYLKNHNDQKSLIRMDNAEIHFLATMMNYSKKSS